MSKNIAIVGGGGFAKEVVEVALMLGYNIYGIFAKENKLTKYKHYGYLDELAKHKEYFDGVIVAIGAVNLEGIQNREKIINFIENHNIPLMSIISPKAIISSDVEIGNGVYVAHNAIISSDSRIMNNVLINHDAIIGHDCIIYSNVSISPQVFLGGSVTVNKFVMIGTGATLRQGITIGHDSMIGMRTIVIRNIKPYSIIMPSISKIYNSNPKKDS